MSYRKWTSWDFIKWKLPRKLGGNEYHVYDFKNAWVKYNANNIKEIAASEHISTDLLAGVAYIEVGGDPHGIDYVAYGVRSADPIIPSWIDQDSLRHPDKTSFGAVSIQLRVAAETLGGNIDELNSFEKASLILLLKSDYENLKISAKHLYDLLNIDFPYVFNPTCLTDEQIRITGSRYNRGPHLSLEQIKQNTDYGDRILRERPVVRELINHSGCYPAPDYIPTTYYV